MGFRIRKTVKILPGIKLNLSKSGISASIGTPGATINLKGGRKAKTTLGIPGTGIHYTSGGEKYPPSVTGTSLTSSAADTPNSPSATRGVLWIAIIVVAIVAVAKLL